MCIYINFHIQEITTLNSRKICRIIRLISTFHSRTSRSGLHHGQYGHREWPGVARRRVVHVRVGRTLALRRAKIPRGNAKSPAAGTVERRRDANRHLSPGDQRSLGEIQRAGHRNDNHKNWTVSTSYLYQITYYLRGLPIYLRYKIMYLFIVGDEVIKLLCVASEPIVGGRETRYKEIFQIDYKSVRCLIMIKKYIYRLLRLFCRTVFHPPINTNAAKLYLQAPLPPCTGV